ncbi:MAG: DUF2490 domain-containing protein [Candidatus Omnitrophota bacterium]
MKGNTLFAILASFFVILNVRAYAYDDGDFQVWSTFGEEVKISQDLKVALEEEFRWGNDASDFYYQHYDLGVSYNLKKWLGVGGGYRHILNKVRGDFKVENAPYLTATLNWRLGEFKFDSRSRFEYQHFDYQADTGRYRNKFTIKLPLKFTEFEIQPYLADEIFLNFQNETFNRNRFYAGFGMNLTKDLKAEIYYLLQSSRSQNKWSDLHAFGSKLKFSF